MGDYPYASSGFYKNPIVHNNGRFFLFGGRYAGYNEDVIAMLDVATRSWSRVGSLNEGRYGHAVVVRQNDYIILGGYQTKGTERCVLENNEMTCEVVEPNMTIFYLNP